MIDDAHVLTHPEILHGLDSIICSRDPLVRIVLAARSDPLLPLHRYRLDGQMFELRADDLAMTEPEARALIEAHGVALSPQDFAVLTARTEGWTAGIRLSAMRMEGAERPADFVAEFAVDQGSIGEYLTYEVLDRLPAQDRQMLVQTGFLDVVSGELAAAVTGIDACADVLDRLARTNSFVVPVDVAHTRYRYHPLLAEILRYTLQHQGPGPAATLFGRAATWFEEQHDNQAALHWAVMAQDTARATSLLARRVLTEAFVRGPGIAAADLVGLLPPDSSEDAGATRAPETAMARLAIDALTADAESAGDRLDRAEQLATAELPDDLRTSRNLSIIMLGRKAGDAHAVGSAAAAQLRTVDDSVPSELRTGLRARVLIAQAQAQFWDDRHDDVEPLLAEALALARSEELAGIELEALGMLALVNSYWSKAARSTDAEDRAREIIRSSTYLATPLALELALAHRSGVRGDFQTMSLALRRAVGAAPAETDLALLALIAQTRAQLLIAIGRVSAAKAVLEAAPPLRQGTAMLKAQREVLLATIETALGRPHRALQLLDLRCEGSSGAEVAVAAARTQVALGNLRAAEDSVRKVVTGQCTVAGRRPLVDALLCNAQIAQLRDDRNRAVESVFRAIEIADGDVVLPFTQVGDTFTSLLVRHPLVAAKWPVAAQRVNHDIDVEGPSERSAGLPEPLTEREQAVLRFLSTTMSTAEIADELYLSVNTIKTHLGSIYRKLAAAKRRDAVRRARELELL